MEQTTNFDINKVNIFQQPVKCWYKKTHDDRYIQGWSKGTTGTSVVVLLTDVNASTTPSKISLLVNDCVWVANENVLWSPPATTRQMTDAEVFEYLYNGAVLRFCYKPNNYTLSNYWCDNYDKSKYEICYNYKGTEKDVWEKLEVELDND